MTSLFKLPAPPAGTRHVRRQAGGHLEQNGDATIPNLEHSDGSFLKWYRRPQRGDTELAFYKRVMNERDTDASLEALRPLVPKFDGIYTTTYNGIEVKYLKVEDITRRFTHPCILDIKLKAHVHDPSSIHDHPTYVFAKQQGFLIDGMQVYDIVKRKYIALFKDFGRKLDDNGVKEVTCMVASVLSLVAISADRFIGIIFPFAPRMTNKIAVLTIVIIWIAAAGVSVPQGLNRKYKERQWADYLEKYCIEDKDALKTYWLLMLGLVVWGPLVIMLVAYTIIICKIDRYDRIVRQSHNVLQIRQRRRVIVMLFTIIVVFFLCWLPFQVLVLHRNFTKLSGKPVSEWFKVTFFVAHFLALSNCAINPFIYGAANVNFRRAFSIQFPCLIPKSKRIRRSMIQFIYSPSMKGVISEHGNNNSDAPTLGTDIDDGSADVNANEVPIEVLKMDDGVPHSTPPYQNEVLDGGNSTTTRY